MKRINFAVTSFCFLLLMVYASNANAVSLTPKERIEVTSSKIMSLLLQEDFRNPETKDQIIDKLEAEIMLLFDFSEFSSRTVGPRWRQFTPTQKEGFQKAFTNLIRNSYIQTLDKYNGESIVYVGEIMAKDNQRVEVHTLFQAKENEFPVSFRMLIKNDEWVVYDVIIEGISMIKNYREQFRDILSSSTPEELIARINEKAEEQLIVRNAE